jgi:predicted phage baseplate assembly protein
MPLPLPNLDTRRWTDLVDEGRALIPQYAPGWTDHNIHDPGITLIELLAWKVEQDMYRVNRVPAWDRRKFLDLIGFPPLPPQAANTPMTFTLAPAAPPQLLPAGLTVAAARSDGPPLRFRTLADLNAVAVAIQAVQSFDGSTFVDATQLWREGTGLLPWGSDPWTSEPTDPAQEPALYLGFDAALPPGVTVSLWLRFQGPGSDQTERQRIIDEAKEQEKACQPFGPSTSCTPSPPVPDQWCPPEPPPPPPPPPPANGNGLPPHHTVRTIWEYYDGAAWQVLNPAVGQVADQTRSFTLDGAVQLTVPAAMGAAALGAVPTSLFYVRCRLDAGPPDAAPIVLDLSINTVDAEQASAVRGTFAIAPGTVPPAGKDPVVGSSGILHLTLDAGGTITALAFDSTGQAPEVQILAYTAATAAAPGSLTVTVVLAGRGTGSPDLLLSLPGAPIARGVAAIWTPAATDWQQWRQRPDLDASKRTDTDFALDAPTGVVRFGSGERGEVVAKDAPVLASCDVTAGATGNIAASALWSLVGADDAVNQALLAGNLSATAAALKTIENGAPATQGADEEDLDHAAGRAVEAFWAHERLVELCPPGQRATLDQLDRAQVLARVAPSRATTLLDFERLALNVPGTRVARARAWRAIDPNYSCLHAPGTVTVIIVPQLPVDQPQPSAGLVRAVYRYLSRRRVICTRLVVVGPTYLVVRVQATVQSMPGYPPNAIRDAVVAALDRFLDPLQGGRAGRGWPFGRSVYRAEILEVIATVPGADYILALDLVPSSGEPQCGNLCLPPTWLVTPGPHSIAVQ